MPDGRAPQQDSPRSWSTTSATSVVLGSSGFLGQNFVDACLAGGVRPLCTYRGRVPRMSTRRRGVDTVFADMDDFESLVSALEGADVVFHFGAHYPALSLTPTATMVHGLGQLGRVLDACAAAGVSRMVYVSSIATVAHNPGGPATERHTFDERPGFGLYHDLKWAMEQQVSAEDRFETVTLVPGACLGPFDMRIGTSAMLVATARGQSVPHPDGWINVCDARDVASIALCVGGMQSPPTRLLVSGSNHRLHAFLMMLADRYRVPSPDAPLDAELAVQRANDAERRAAEQGVRAEMSRELVDLTIHGKPVDASLATRLTSITYRPLSDTLDAFEQWARKRHIIPSNDPPTHMERNV